MHLVGDTRILEHQELFNLHYTQNIVRRITADEKLYESFSTDKGNEKFVPNFRRELDVNYGCQDAAIRKQ